MRAAEGTGPPKKENPPVGGGLSRKFPHGLRTNPITDSANISKLFSTPAAVEVERRMEVAYLAGKAVRA